MSSGSFEFWFDLVFAFIFGFIVKHYLEEVKIPYQKFVEIVQECVVPDRDCDRLNSSLDILVGKERSWIGFN